MRSLSSGLGFGPGIGGTSGQEKWEVGNPDSNMVETEPGRQEDHMKSEALLLWGMGSHSLFLGMGPGYFAAQQSWKEVLTEMLSRTGRR